MDFSDSIIEFSNIVQAAMTQVFKDVVIEVGESVVTLSPVLTGRFKGNWQLSVNAPISNSLNIFDQAGSGTLAKLITGSESLQIGDVAYIVNNILYGYEIEVGGWPSGKEPYMPVRITEAKFKDIVDAAIARRQV